MIIIPDVHGRTFWKDAVKNRETEEIIFLGDYLDPYDFENIDRTFTIDNFKEIIKFKKSHNDNVTLLLGNHDLGYISQYICRCRTDIFNYEEIRNLFINNKECFTLGKYETINNVNYSFTHSIILKMWAEEPRVKHLIGEVKTIPEIIDKLNEAWETQDIGKLNGLLAYISFSRGGYCDEGSPVWADVSEADIFKAEFSDYYQVFGHSQQYINPVITMNFACLDCRRAFELVDDEFNGITPESNIYSYLY